MALPAYRQINGEPAKVTRFAALKLGKARFGIPSCLLN
jgi:hypothetical protein